MDAYSYFHVPTQSPHTLNQLEPKLSAVKVYCEEFDFCLIICCQEAVSKSYTIEITNCKTGNYNKQIKTDIC